MDALLISLSGVLTIAAAVPYIVQIMRGKVKPRIVSWFTWSLLTGIACAAAFSDGQIANGILMLCATIEVLIVAILGFRIGDRKFDRLDIFCQAAAVAGLVLWLVFNSPAVAILAAVTIDLIGAIPTFKHSWLRPYEEAWITYSMSGLGALCTMLVITDWQITSVAYPIYLVLANALITALIVLSPRRKLAGEPAELKEL
jgi:hypothetical protein